LASVCEPFPPVGGKVYQSEAIALMHKAFDLGITLYDAGHLLSITGNGAAIFETG